MSKRELERVEVLARIRSKQLRIADASRLMGVSYRQAKRLWKRYREEGAAGLKHRSAGRHSNHARELKFRKKVLELVREKYGGAVGERFGPTLAAEHLASEGGHFYRALTKKCKKWQKVASQQKVASLDFVELLRYPPRNTSIRYEFSSPM
jgi:transposase